MKQLKHRRNYSKAFRTQAVEMWLTGRDVHELGAELGVSSMTLRRWRQEYMEEMESAGAQSTQLSPLKMQEELQRLRKENQKLKLHQEILKKALGILSDRPPTGMP